MMSKNKVALGGKRGKGKHSVVDPEDYERAAAKFWHFRADGYAATSVGVLMHRFIMRANPDQMVDHANMDKLDNRKSNLRFCTKSQNTANSKCRNPLGYKGVHVHRGKFLAKITVNRKVHHLGVFDCVKDAAHAYDVSAFNAFGEFARLNFPKGAT